ncbi:MAG: Arm DNA-binding domain-containing protein [Bacteroidaceae bacterium]
MNVTVNVICYKSKVLKNSESPLMIRVYKDKKRKYINLRLSINSIYWDFTKNAPKLQSYSEQTMEFKAMDRDFTATNLVEKVSKPSNLKTVEEM